MEVILTLCQRRLHHDLVCPGAVLMEEMEVEMGVGAEVDISAAMETGGTLLSLR